MPSTRPREQHYTYADYAQWPEDERWELIDGVPYCMSPAPGVAHQEVVLSIGAGLRERLRGTPCRVLLAPLDVLLPRPGQSDEATETVVQPDVLVVCRPERVTQRYVRGAPDLVVEVLSPGTAKKDEGVKRDLYEQAGVAEYWLVHPVDRTINRYALLDGRYGRPDVFGCGDELQSARFPELSLSLDELFETEPEPQPLPPPERVPPG